MNNKSQTPAELRKKKLQKINEFFTDCTSPETFAKDTRRFLYESMKMALTPPEKRYIPDPKWVNNGIEVLNSLCEVLQPVMEDDDDEVNTYINI